MDGLLLHNGFSTVNKGFQLLSKGFQFADKGFQFPSGDLFARYFRPLPAYSTIGTEEVVRDTFNNQNFLAEPTTVINADGTLTMEWTESDYSTDWDKVVVSYVTTNNVGELITGTRSGGVYTVNFPTGVVSKVKLWDENGYALGSEEVTNGGFDADTDWIKGTGWSIGSGVASQSGLVGNLEQQLNESPNSLYLLNVDLLNYIGGTYNVEITGANTGVSATSQNRIVKTFTNTSATFKIKSAGIASDFDNISLKQVILTQEQITRTTETEAIAFYPCEEGAGDGATDNVICFDVLNDGIYATITNNVSGSTWTTDKTVESYNNARGYGVGENYLKWSEDFSNTDWKTGEGSIKSERSLTFGVSFNSRVFQGADIKQNTNYTLSIPLSDGDIGKEIRLGFFTGTWDYGTNIVVPSSGIVERTFSSASVIQYIGIVQGVGFSDTTITLKDDLGTQLKQSSSAVTYYKTENYVIQGNTRIPISQTNPTKTVLNTTPDYLGISNKAFIPVEQNCVIGDGTAKLTFASLPTYDAITIIEDGTETSISLTANEYVLGSGKKYNSVVFKNIGVTVAEFLINEYDNTKEIPSNISFHDRYESGATCVLTNGSDANIEKAEGLTGNFKYGFNPALVSDGVDDHIQINSAISETLTIEAVIKPKTDLSTARKYFIDFRKSGGTGFISYFGNLTSWSNSGGTTYINDVETNSFNFGEYFKLEVRDIPVVSSIAEVFAFNGVTEFTSLSVLYIIIKNSSGDEMFHFIPQLDGTLLDTVNNVVYTNQGTGDLGQVMIPASQPNPTKDIAGVDLRYLPNNTQNEQEIKAIEIKEWIDRGDYFLGKNPAVVSDGINDGITIPDSSKLDVGTGDFEVGFTIELNNTGSSQSYISKYNASGNAWDFNLLSSGNYEFIFRNPNVFVLSGSAASDIGKIVSFLIKRESGVCTVYKNGVLANTVALTNDIDNSNDINIFRRLAGLYALTKLSNAYFKSGDTLAFNLVPQLDGTLYDSVNDVTYTNDSTGDFGTSDFFPLFTSGNANTIRLDQVAGVNEDNFIQLDSDGNIIDLKLRT